MLARAPNFFKFLNFPTTVFPMCPDLWHPMEHRGRVVKAKGNAFGDFPKVKGGEYG